MFLTLFFLAACVFCIVAVILCWDGKDVWIGGAVASGIAFILSLIILLVAYTCSLDNYAKLLTYHEMMPLYEKIIAQPEALSKQETDGVAAIGSGLYNLKHSTNLAERVVEIRDYMRWYKETRRQYQMYSERWYIRQWIAKMPATLLEE